ncbi:segregation/condensation protein A [Candidatus Kaiserbacteria bacterium]|nr:segregation/condensation protein A [Candidatus Kaiserbacteria bacterium]
MSEKFTLATEQYQGPLEALLDMIEARKMSITDISLADVTDSYLAYVEKLPSLPLGETAQFILVASTLLLIKSRTLLPSMDLTEEERESVDELERRLARLRIVRECAKMLRKSWGLAPYRFPVRSPARAAFFSPAESSVDTIHAAALKLLQILPKPETLIEASVAPVLALEDVIAGLKKRLTTAFKARFSELTQTRDKHEVIVYFLAMLELVRSGSASVSQEKLFEDITIEIEQVGAPRYGA